MLPLIIVRPEPGASATRQRAAALGLSATAIPLFRIEPLAWQPPDPANFDAMLLSSANALRSAGPGLAALAGLPAFAVGPATAAAAKLAGLAPVAVGSDGAQTLVEAMAGEGLHRILWLCGADRSALAPGAARITPLVTYRAATITDPPGWDAAIAAPAVLMLHSARAAQRAGALAGPARKRLIALAISAAVGEAAGAGWHHRAVAEQPDDRDMLALAAQLCQMGRD